MYIETSYFVSVIVNMMLACSPISAKAVPSATVLGFLLMVVGMIAIGMVAPSPAEKLTSSSSSGAMFMFCERSELPHFLALACSLNPPPPPSASSPSPSPVPRLRRAPPPAHAAPSDHDQLPACSMVVPRRTHPWRSISSRRAGAGAAPDVDQAPSLA